MDRGRDCSPVRAGFVSIERGQGNVSIMTGDRNRPMQLVERTLISFFEQVAQQDQVILEKLRDDQSFSVKLGHWCFTLPDLYRFLQCHEEVFEGVTYKQFRQMIFNGPINQTVKHYGAKIEIADNQAKVDRSRYALVWPVKRNFESLTKSAPRHHNDT